MVGHITSKVKSAIALWPSTGTSWDECSKHVVAEELVSSLLSHPVYSSSNKVLSEAGTRLCKALTVLDYRLVTEGGTDVTELLNKYDSYLLANQTIFEDISKHHTQIGAQLWSDVAANEASLSVYSTAAAAMGTKTWVAECNEWMKTFAYTYFRNGGARKHHMRKTTIQSDFECQNVINKEKVDFQKDLMLLSADQVPSKIRLLDVGSCYNPIAKSAEAESFAVTALDLYPADPTVFQCDFLNVGIGSEGSAPIIEMQQPIEPTAACTTQSNSSITAKHACKKRRLSKDEASAVPAEGECIQKIAPEIAQNVHTSAKLLQLPAASFDAVTMSLVLNYLPTPAQRLQMVRNARALLVSPTFSSQPHRNGLFIIAEKQSIFKNPQAYAKANQKECPVEGSGEQAGNAERDYWSCWVKSISSCGFELVKYHYFPTTDGRKSHLFAFATVGTAPPPVDEQATDPECQLWIKQDHETKL